MGPLVFSLVAQWGFGLSADDRDALEAVDLAQRTFKKLGGPEWKIDFGCVLDVQDDRDARGGHAIFSLG